MTLVLDRIFPKSLGKNIVNFVKIMKAGVSPFSLNLQMSFFNV